jgi:hypothetical protein
MNHIDSLDTVSQRNIIIGIISGSLLTTNSKNDKKIIDTLRMSSPSRRRVASQLDLTTALRGIIGLSVHDGLNIADSRSKKSKGIQPRETATTFYGSPGSPGQKLKKSISVANITLSGVNWKTSNKDMRQERDMYH